MPNNALTTRTESLLAAYAKATPGEWEVITSEKGDAYITTCDGHVAKRVEGSFLGEAWHDNAAAICALHNEAPALLRDLLSQVAFLEAALGELKDVLPTAWAEDLRDWQQDYGTLPNLAKWLQEGE
jgi:hypothetical protein